MKNQAGFTMIEVIVTLVLVGIVALMGGMAIVQVTQGYIFTKDNAELTQKAQLATSRITKEIVEMTGISADATASTLPLKNNIRNVTIGLNAGSIKALNNELTPTPIQITTSEGCALIIVTKHIKSPSRITIHRESSSPSVIMIRQDSKGSTGLNQ